MYAKPIKSNRKTINVRAMNLPVVLPSCHVIKIEQRLTFFMMLCNDDGEFEILTILPPLRQFSHINVALNESRTTATEHDTRKPFNFPPKSVQKRKFHANKSLESETTEGVVGKTNMLSCRLHQNIDIGRQNTK